MEHLTTDIITRLGDKNPWLNSVAENYGQLTRMSDGAGDTYPVISPAALVDVQGIEWQTMGGGDQKGRATAVVTLAIDCYDDAPSLPARADEWEREAQASAQREKMLDDISQTLHQWAPPSAAGILTRQSTRPYALPHGWKAYEVTLTCPVWSMSKPAADTAADDGTLPLSVYD